MTIHDKIKFLSERMELTDNDEEFLFLYKRKSHYEDVRDGGKLLKKHTLSL